jgi:hypothetical protein
VHGNNGLIFTPANGSGKKYFPPSVLALGDGDTLQITRSRPAITRPPRRQLVKAAA